MRYNDDFSIFWLGLQILTSEVVFQFETAKPLGLDLADFSALKTPNLINHQRPCSLMTYVHRVQVRSWLMILHLSILIPPPSSKPYSIL